MAAEKAAIMAVACRIMVPKGIHVPIPGTYVILHGKRNFADVIKAMDLKIGRLFWIIWVGSI